MNLLLIDSEIPGLDIFINSCNSNTKCIVYHTKQVTFQMLEKKISTLNVTRYNNLGFVFLNDNIVVDKLFLDNRPFINYQYNEEQDSIKIIENTTTSFIKYLVKKYYIKTIDFLACDLLNETIWKSYFEFIRTQNNVKLRASNDRTGNLSSGGDWILESTGENVEKLYFNTNIQYWNYLLDIGQSSTSSYVITTDNSNNLYSCGRNNSGQLGLTNTIDKNTFQNVISGIISGKKVISVMSGNEFAMLLTDENVNNLYSCGKNNSGQLGLNNTTTTNTNPFQNVNIGIISGKKTLAVSCGFEHSILITNETSNNFYSCGRNNEGQLGLGLGFIGNNKSTFQRLTIGTLSGKKITSISTGAYSSYVLTNELSNNLYSCGRNLNGELGLGTGTNINAFQNITFNISGKKIMTVTGGWYSSYLLTNEESNNLYSTGYNSYGELGLGDNLDKNKYTNVTNNISGKKIISVSTGNQHCLILTNDSSNNLYVCGRNTSGQLALGHYDTINVFTQSSNTILNKYYNGISCGDGMSLITTSDTFNNLYTFGSNLYGQLGLGTNKQMTTLTNSLINLVGKKIILNERMSHDIPIHSSFQNFNYGNNNVTYYSTALEKHNNVISIGSLANPETHFPSLIGVIGEAYELKPHNTFFSKPISFKLKSLYLSKVYYQEHMNSKLYMMSTNRNQLPYYTYDGTYITIYSLYLFSYLVFTVPETKSGSQFSNLNNLIISAADEPFMLQKTRLNCSFLNTADVSINDINEWDVSSSVTMSSMFRDSSFNGTITNWKPKAVNDMSYMFYGASKFNKKISYDPSYESWDVSSVKNMKSMFHSSSFNNSQNIGGSTEPLNWILNEDVNLTDITNSSNLTLSNAQTLTPELLMYLNVGTLSESSSSGSNNYDFYIENENGVNAITKAIEVTPKYTFLCSRYNIAGDPLWSFKIDCSATGVEYPPSPLTGNVTDISGNYYGNGRYFVSTSNNSSYSWNVGDYTDSYWRSNSNYSYNGELKTSGTSTSTNLGTIYGEWVEYTLPYNISLKQFIINKARIDRLSPKSIAIAGLDENNAWIVVYKTDNINLNQNKTINLDTPSIYSNRFRMIIRSVLNNEYVEIPEWRLVEYTGITGSRLSEGSISSDPSRNVFVSGIWYNSLNSVCRFYNKNDTQASTLNFSGASKQNVFLVKYDNNGIFSWRTSISGTDPSCGIMLSNTACDINGNIYGIGRNDYSVNIYNANSTLWRTIGNTSNKFNSAWIFKYNNQGIGQWLSRISSTGGSPTDGLVINTDSGNNVYAAGSYDISTNVYDSSNTLIKGFTNKGNWITKYNSNGAVQWATYLRGTNVKIKNIGYSLNRDVFFCGGFNTSDIYFINQTDISFVSLSNQSNDNGFVTKYTSDGICSWAARIGYSTSNSGYNNSLYSEKQFQDIQEKDIIQEGLKFAVYNGYFEDFSGSSTDSYGFGFFYSNYPYYKGITNNFTDISTSTEGLLNSTDSNINYKSVCWYGFFRAKKTGTYVFKTSSDESSFVLINGNIVVNNGGLHGNRTITGNCNLIAGTYYYIQILYGEKTGGQSFSMSYSEPNQDGTANTNNANFISNATGLGTYWTDTEYMGFYDNWINQIGTYSSNNVNLINKRVENHIKILFTDASNQTLNLFNRSSINPNIYKFIHIKYRANNIDKMRLFYSTDVSSFTLENSINIQFTNQTSGENCWKHIILDMNNISTWSNRNWSHYKIDINSFEVGGGNIELKYFYISDSSKYPFNENENSIVVSGISKSQNVDIYNSTFIYNTTGNGNASLSNELVNTYDGYNNSFYKTYIVKYDLNGNVIWSKYLISNGGDVIGHSIKLDKMGNIYIFGQFSGVLSIPNGRTLTNSSNNSSIYDTFIIVYSKDGNYLWSSKQGSNNSNDKVISSSSDLNPLLQGQSLVMS